MQSIDETVISYECEKNKRANNIEGKQLYKRYSQPPFNNNFKSS